MTRESGAEAVLVAGLPGAGKTTYLAALWHVVDSGAVPEALRLKRLSADREHLNAIRTAWIQCVEVQRTTTDSARVVAMTLDDPVRPESPAIDLMIPDLSGETFQEQWERRTWPSELAEMANRARGLLLFVTPSPEREPQRIDTADQLIAALAMGGAPPEADPGGDGLRSEATGAGNVSTMEWHPRFAPTQVILVDLLQSVMLLRHGRPIRVGVVQSAWDTVPTTAAAAGPVNWFASRYPLLDQYLAANRESFVVRHFGVSALGGSIELPTESKRLLSMKPHERIRVTASAGTESNDITLPIRWLLEP